LDQILGELTPPSRFEVQIYFVQLGLSDKHSDAFYYYYSLKKWTLDRDKSVKNWKVLAVNWICSFSKASILSKRWRRC